MTSPTPRNAFVRRPTALSMGLDDNGIARMLSSGQWRVLRHGAYVDVQRVARASAEQRHRMLIEASLPLAADNAAVSHVSAAVLHRYDVWGIPLGTVHLTRPGHGGGHRRRWIHTHVSPLRPDEVMEIDGMPVTTPARTVLDLARAAGVESSVVTADHALHIKSVTPEELEDARQRAMGWPGMVRATRVLAFADGLAESPGESRSRLHIARAGLPKPRLQVRIWSVDGLYLGRADFWFEEFRTVGEFDGRVKYGRMLTEEDLAENAAEKIGRIVFEEKRREDAIRALPSSVGRWVWNEISGRSINILSQAFRTGRSLAVVPMRGRIECS